MRSEVFSTWGKGAPCPSAPDPVLTAVTKQRDAELDREDDLDLYEALSNLYGDEIVTLEAEAPLEPALSLFGHVAAWARSAGLKPIPLGPGAFALYLHAGMNEPDITHERLTQIAAAVSDAHTSFGLADPASTPLARAIINTKKLNGKH